MPSAHVRVKDGYAAAGAVPAASLTWTPLRANRSYAEWQETAIRREPTKI
jgi:hypothetical protein